MRIRALARRILHQFRHDKRTLALMFAAPLLVFTIVFYLLDDNGITVKAAVVNAPEAYLTSLEEHDIEVMRYDEAEAFNALKEGRVTAVLDVRSGRPYVWIDGSDSGKAKAVLAGLEAAGKKPFAARADLMPDVEYVYGYEELSAFDSFGASLIGVLIFFYVFLVAGISFLQERITGTLEKLLSTPIRRWEIVAGYTLGYGIITVVQTIIVTLFVVYALKAMLVGALWIVILITLLTAVSALTLGILMSTLANNEFQLMQFIPLVIIPQIFLSGLFELSPFWETVGHFTPLYYVADALKEVMIRGGGIADILLHLSVIAFCCVFFMSLNTLVLKRYRAI